MLLTISYTGRNTSELGYLLYKNPYRPQMFELSYGNAYVFYPEVSNERTTAAILLEKNGYAVRFSKIGESDEILGAPTQMGVFTLCV